MKNIVPETPPVVDYAFAWARVCLILSCFLLWFAAYSGVSLRNNELLIGVWHFPRLNSVLVLLWLLFFYSLYRFVSRLQAAQWVELSNDWLAQLYSSCNPVLNTAPYSDQLPAGAVSSWCETRVMQWLFRTIDRAIALSKDTSLKSQTNREKLKAGCFDAVTCRLLLRHSLFTSMWFVLRGKLFADYLMPLLLALLVMCYAAVAPWGGSWLA